MAYSVSGAKDNGESVIMLNEGGGTLWVASVTGTVKAATDAVHAGLRDAMPADDYAAIAAAERALTEADIAFAQLSHGLGPHAERG